MRWLGIGCLAFALVPALMPALAPAFAQEQLQLFAPAPKTPASAPHDAQTSPVVRTSLKESLAETPMPTPRPEIRATLAEPIAQVTAAPPPAQRPEPPPAPLPRPQYQAPPTPFPDGVTAQFDITYATLPGFRPLTLDLYRPRARPEPVPMLVFVHGGSWNNGDSRTARAFADFPRALALLAAQGYVVASINYRLSQEAHFPAALQDVKSAIRWMREHAAGFGGDPTRLAVWGASAGGQLAAMAGVTCGVMRFEPDGEVSRDAPSNCPEAVIDWFGPTDLGGLAADNGQPARDGFKPASGGVTAEGRYLGCEPATCEAGVVKLASPLTFVSENAPPFLIQHGGADTEVSPKQAQKLYDTLKAKGVPARIAIYPDVGHQFFRKDAPDTATVTKAMAEMVQFLAATFPVKHNPQIRRTVAN